ncbi:MAG: hypothetical protein QNJ57_12070 [Flavobacteriaceae bacterium]|nr:hypothetical protein [Flavobacteriaceae bacterium]
MVKKLLFTLTFLVFSFSAFGQTDYSKVTFSSKIYRYKNDLPRTAELGIDKQLVSDIIEVLSSSLYDKKQKTEIINKAWLAFVNPKTFDFVYKDFAVKTNNNWRKVNANGEMVLEPNPYLTEWTINDDEFPYFQLALNKILDHYGLLAYGDDAMAVKTSFNKLLITKDFKFENPKEDDWAYSYLKVANENLAKKGLVALVTKGYYDIIVCKIDQKEKITDLFNKLKWELVTP